MVKQTIETNKVINRYNDYLDCNYCNNEIEINDNYFIVFNNEDYRDYIICNKNCLINLIEFIYNN